MGRELILGGGHSSLSSSLDKNESTGCQCGRHAISMFGCVLLWILYLQPGGGGQGLPTAASSLIHLAKHCKV